LQGFCILLNVLSKITQHCEQIAHSSARKLLVGGDGTPLEAFLATSDSSLPG